MPMLKYDNAIPVFGAVYRSPFHMNRSKKGVNAYGNFSGGLGGLRPFYTS